MKYIYIVTAQLIGLIQYDIKSTVPRVENNILSRVSKDIWPELCEDNHSELQIASLLYL